MEKNPPNARLMALPSSWSDLAVYGTALGLVILAIFLGLQAGLAYALAALLLAALSLVTVTKVLRHKNAALLQKELSDENLLQSQKLASVGELSAGIAHEINNPLAIIRQEAEWLLQLYKKDAPPDGPGNQKLPGRDRPSGGPGPGNNP